MRLIATALSPALPAYPLSASSPRNSCIYYAVALDRRYDGDEDAEVIRLLELVDFEVTGSDPRALGPTNIILGKSTLARAYRRTDKVDKAEAL